MELPRVEPVRTSLRRAWTSQEDEVLQHEAELQLQNGSLRDWKLIATKLPRRTNKDCRKRWTKIRDNVNKGPWNQREDEMLEEAVQQLGPQWVSVAKRVGTRHADQCAKRWRHFLDPDLDHSQWERKDDARLWAAVETHGSNWRRIVEEDFPERSPTNVKNRHAVIKTLWRRGNGFSRTPSTPEVNEVETPGYLLMNEASSSSKDSVSANSIAFTTDAESPWDFKNIVFSPGALDVDFGFFLPNPLTPKGLRSPILSTGSLKDANASTGIFPSVSHCTTPVFKPAVHMEHPSNTTSWSAGSQMPDFADYGVASSLDLEYIPQIELEVSNDTGSELRQGLLCEPQIDALADKWTSCAVEGLSSNTARGQTASPSNDSAFVPDEAKTVSLCLEDMEPETANMVTSILFKSNIDLKMKMTVR